MIFARITGHKMLGMIFSINFVWNIYPSKKNLARYRGADKSLARPGRKQARKHVRYTRDFNNIETKAVKFLFSCKARRRRKFTPFWEKHYFVSFLVGLRTYQHSFSVEFPLFLSKFNETWIFSAEIQKKFQIPNFAKIRPVGDRVFPCDGQTDVTKLTVDFLKSVNTPKNKSVLQYTALIGT